MQFTGERYLPERKGDISLEHRHRYLLACLYANGKEVLDIACGEGYGSSMLSSVAKRVVGVDIAEEAVEHAIATYPSENLQFKQGEASHIPLEDASVDLVVSFETIEHHDQHEAMMQEIKRVLKPHGLLLISSPDKYEYSDISGDRNEFHVRELYKEEFSELLARHFAHHTLSGQRVTYGSVIASATEESFSSWEHDVPNQEQGLSHAMYWIALASDGILPELGHSILKTPVSESDSFCDIQRYSEELKNNIHIQEERLAEYYSYIDTLREQKDALDSTIQELNKTIEEKNHKAEKFQEELHKLYNSRSWRITRPLRDAAGWLRNLFQPKPRCNKLSLAIAALALLPTFVVYYKGVLGAIHALRMGKPAFTNVFSKGIQALEEIEITHPNLWSFCTLLLVFSRRIYKNGGVLPAIYKTKELVATYGNGVLFSDKESLVQSKNKTIACADVLKRIAPQQNIPQMIPQTTVIIPVYNGFNFLLSLTQTLFEYSPEDTQYIFIDDASPDPRVNIFLQEEIASRNNCMVLRNESNLGFVKTVNTAAKHVTTPYFVLLNTDVLVPQYWLERIVAPFLQNKKIASVTPFTNSGVYFSYPIRGIDNVIPKETTYEELDTAFAKLSSTINSECTIHSGVGFCMAINKACWDTIGPLDEEAFTRGYGEECDWCMRAISKQWRNVLVPNLFVYHAHGGSFTSLEKQRLIDEHSKILQDRWPQQMATVAIHEQENPWEAYRAAASLLLANSPRPEEKTILMVDVSLSTGGAYAFREKKIREFQEAGHRILLLLFTPDGDWSLTPRYLNSQSVVSLDSLDELSQITEQVHLDSIFVNNVAFCKETEAILDILTTLKNRYACTIDYMFHDFYCICPSFFLLDDATHYCNIGKTEKCLECAPHNNNFVIRRTDIQAWRSSWSTFLDSCDRFFFFCQATLDIVNTTYPVQEKAVIQEHEILAPFKEPYILPDASEPLVIGFLGPFVEQKGSTFMRELGKLLCQKDPSARIHLFGTHYESSTKQGNLYFEGPYIRDHIPTILSEKKVKAVILPSPSPETFSYIAQECMSLNVPFVCFDIGAPAERMHKYNYEYGAVAKEFTAESLLNAVETLLEKVYSGKNS